MAFLSLRCFSYLAWRCAAFEETGMKGVSAATCSALPEGAPAEKSAPMDSVSEMEEGLEKGGGVGSDAPSDTWAEDPAAGGDAPAGAEGKEIVDPEGDAPLGIRKLGAANPGGDAPSEVGGMEDGVGMGAISIISPELEEEEVG